MQRGTGRDFFQNTAEYSSGFAEIIPFAGFIFMEPIVGFFKIEGFIDCVCESSFMRYGEYFDNIESGLLEVIFKNIFPELVLKKFFLIRFSREYFSDKFI